MHIVFKSVLLIALAFLVLNTVVDDRCECAMYISFTGFLVGFRSLTKMIVSSWFYFLVSLIILVLGSWSLLRFSMSFMRNPLIYNIDNTDMLIVFITRPSVYIGNQ